MCNDGWESSLSSFFLCLRSLPLSFEEKVALCEKIADALEGMPIGKVDFLIKSLRPLRSNTIPLSERDLSGREIKENVPSER